MKMEFLSTVGAAKRRSIILLFLVLGAILLSVGCSGAKPAEAGARRQNLVVPVVITTAVQKDVPIQVKAIGNVEAYSTVMIKSQIGGQLLKVHFKEGDDISKGQLLFTIDRRPFEAALRRAESTLARSEAQAAQARSDAKRYEALFKEGVVAKAAFDQMVSTADALEAAARADHAAVENARLDLSYTEIRSPIDGRTGDLAVHEGNLVKANDVALVTLNQMQPILVTFTVPEQRLAEVKMYFGAGKRPVAARLPNDSKPISGLLNFIDNAVDPATGTIRLKAVFTNADRRLWPGQFVDVLLTMTTRPNAVVIPAEAVQTSQQGQFVYVIKQDNTAEVRPVKLGTTLEGSVIIEEGVRPGDRVVTDGALRLAPGSKVEIKPAAASALATSENRS